MRPPTPTKPVTDDLPTWEIYEGMNFLYLVGPGPKAMVRCGSIPPTLAQLKIARKALALLIPQQDAGEAEIKAALKECGYEEEA